MRKRGNAAVLYPTAQEPKREYTGGDCTLCGRPLFREGSFITCPGGHVVDVPNPGLESLRNPTTGVLEPRAKKLEPPVVEASKALAQEIAKNDRDPEAWNVKEKDRRERAVQALRPDMERVVERTFVDDIEKTYEALEAALKLGDRRTDYGSVMRSLDEAESNARSAFKLWATASVEYDRWELENREVLASMRAEAHARLQAEKEAKIRNKAITDADVEDMASLMFPDEYAVQELRRKKAKRFVDSTKNLMETWQSRCFGLRTLADKLR